MRRQCGVCAGCCVGVAVCIHIISIHMSNIYGRAWLVLVPVVLVAAYAASF